METPWVKIANGSFGSRNGQPWSRALAAANSQTAPIDVGAGMHGAIVAPSKEALRAAIESQICPWCGNGPYKMLAMHANLQHGIDRMELREMAGLSRSSSICSPSTSEDSRRALVERPDRADITRKGAAAGHAIASQVARDLSAIRYKEQQCERDADIVAAVASGVHRKVVASDFGLTYGTVLRILKRSGVIEDGRADRGRDRSGSMPAGALAGIERKGADRLAERKRQWDALGGGHDALVRLAEELGTSQKALRAYFKRSGVPVPDGRK